MGNSVDCYYKDVYAFIFVCLDCGDLMELFVCLVVHWCSLGVGLLWLDGLFIGVIVVYISFVIWLIGCVPVFACWFGLLV